MLQIIQSARNNSLHAMLLPMTSDGMVNVHALEINRFYDVSWYAKLKRDPAIWKEVFAPINDFLATLDGIEEHHLEAAYRVARDAIDDDTVGVVAAAKSLITLLQGDLDVIPRLIRFVSTETKFSLPELSCASDMPAPGIERLTFGREEYIQLIVISLLCKLLAPLWGHIYAQRRSNETTMECGVRCLKLILPLLTTTTLAPIYQKLQTLIDKTVMCELKHYSAAQIDHHRKDRLLVRFVELTTETILVKRYVNIDLYKPGGNILVWTTTNAKLSFASLIGKPNFQIKS